jgi:hypothetical protein
MLLKAVRTGAIAGLVLVLAGAIVGALGTHASEDDVLRGGLLGAGAGLAIALVAFAHLAIRTVFGRVPEAQVEELAEHSVERETFRRAGERAFPDVISIVLAAGLLSAFLTDGALLRWLPVVTAILALADFALRALFQWKELVGTRWKTTSVNDEPSSA